MSIIKRAVSFTAAVSFVFAVLATATFINLGSVSYADGNDSPDACLGKTANVVGSVEGSDSQVSYKVKSFEVVEGVCIKSGNNSFGDLQHSGVLGNGIYEEGCYEVTGVGTRTVTVKRLIESNDCKGISHIDVVYDNKDETNYCDPSEKPGGISIATWLERNKIDGADCFDYEVVQQCGYLNVSLTEYPVFAGKPYSAVYTTNGKVELPANSFPAEFDEDENNGSVNVTWFIVGPEKDYLVGTSLPNYWDGTSKTVAVDTDCEDAPEEEEDEDDGAVLAADTDAKQVAVTPVGAADAGGAGTAAFVGLVGSTLAVSLGAVIRRFSL
jgi:hypothetical protein